MARKTYTEAERQAKREEMRERMEASARDLLSSDGWLAFARTRARFHRYSWGNCALIAAQCPEATRVAGFRTWQDLGRQVRRGERAIMILAPRTFKRTDENGEEERHLYFRAVPVFDVSQTDGDPLPEAPHGEPLTGDSHADCIPLLEAFAQSIDWTVERGDTLPADGWAMPSEQRIRIGAHLEAPNAIVRTLVHELVHALGVDYNDRSRREAETITETAAWIVCESIGLDTSSLAVPYVAGWGERDLDAIKRCAQTVDEVARQLERALGVNGAEVDSES